MVHIRTILYFHCRHAQALAGKYSTDFHHVIYHIFQHTHTKTHTPRHTHKHTHANTHISHTHSCRVLSFRRSGGTPHTLLPLSLLCIYLFMLLFMHVCFIGFSHFGDPAAFHTQYCPRRERGQQHRRKRGQRLQSGMHALYDNI